MMYNLILNHNNTFFCQLAENLKIVHSFMSINIEIVADTVAGAGALLTGILNINTEIIVDPVAGAGALLTGILSMDIGNLVNTVPELSEQEKDKRRRSNLSNKLRTQIFENETL